jgi:hypothetical protein
MYCLPAVSRFTRWAAIAAALALSAPAAYAQKPSPAALLTAGEIVTATGAMALFTPLIPGVVEQAKNLFLQQDPGLAKDLNEIVAKMRSDLAPRLGELSGQVAKNYAERFTEQELKDLLAFYKSPVGKKLIAEQPKIADASLRYAQDWANKLSDEVVKKMRAELKKKGHAL